MVTEHGKMAKLITHHCGLAFALVILLNVLVTAIHCFKTGLKTSSISDFRLATKIFTIDTTISITAHFFTATFIIHTPYGEDNIQKLCWIDSGLTSINTCRLPLFKTARNEGSKYTL